MELMSALLLFVFVATLPQTLELAISKDLRFNNSLKIENSVSNKRIRSGFGPSIYYYANELQTVFLDFNCQRCLKCMERAIRAYSKPTYVVSNPNSLESQYQMPHGSGFRRYSKRSLAQAEQSDTKNKTKSNTILKKLTFNNATITKYTNSNGNVYAIKVNGLNNQTSGQNVSGSICKVYSIKKTRNCDRGSDIILPKKGNNKGKVLKNKVKSRTTPKPKTTMARKQQVPATSSHMAPEKIMLSIE